MDKPTLIPVFLEAKSKKELVSLMLKNNLTHGMHFRYMPPLKDGKKWVVWYHIDIANHNMKQLISGVLND